MKNFFLTGLICLSLASCQREIDKYYELPDWLKGNAYEVMSDKGTFTLFMKAVERSSYADLVKGKGIVTVMAPTDDAFNVYLTKHGYTSVDEIPEVELNKLVGFHLVYYSYTKNNFMFYNPDGADVVLQEPGSYFKFRTKSRDAISTATDYANGGVIRKIMHKERFIPVVSNFSLAYWQNSAKEEYEQLFPGSIYSGSIDQFNIANANVVETETVTDNGYLYVIDQVLEPLETIYAELTKTESKYTKFAALYDRFERYEYDADATADYGKGDSLFVHSHIYLPPIACEWTNKTSNVPDYAQTANLASRSFATLAPSNEAVNKFYQKYWAASFSSLEEVNYVPLFYFMKAHAFSFGAKMITPSVLNNLIVQNDNVDGETVMPDYIKVCSNGILGGMNNVVTPGVFETSIAPALCDKSYNIFALIAEKGDVINKFDASYESNFVVFYPTNDMLLRSEYNGDFIQYLKGNSHIINDEKVKVANSTDGTIGDISWTQAQSIAGAHIVDNVVSQRSGTELIYGTYNEYEYLYRIGDEVYSSAAWNAKALGYPTSVPKIKLIKDYGKRGTAYALTDDNTTTSLLPEQGNFKDHVVQDKSMVAFGGMNLYLNAAPSIKAEPAFNFLQGNRFIVFMPTQASVTKDFTTTMRFPLRGTADAKENYVKSLFIDISTSALMDYPFGTLGKTSEKVLTTFGTKTVNGKKEKITVTLINNADGSMQLKDAKGNVVNITSYFPYIYADGAAYVIDGVLDLLN